MSLNIPPEMSSASTAPLLSISQGSKASLQEPSGGTQGACSGHTESKHVLPFASPDDIETASQLAALTIDGTSSAPRRGLLRLPNELLVGIITYQSYQDLVSLALTCRLVHRLAKESLAEHQDLLNELSVQECTPDNRDVAGLFRYMFQDRFDAQYLRRLVVWPLQKSWYFVDPEERTDTKWILARVKSNPLKSFIDETIADAVGQRPLYSLKYKLLRSMGRGEEMPLLPFLRVLLPNLSSLEIHLRPPFVEYEDDDYAANPNTSADDDWQIEFLALVLQPSRFSIANDGLFAKLKTIKIEGPSHCQDQPFDLLVACTQIPTVESLTGVRCRQKSHTKPIFKCKSNVKRLTLTNCIVDMETLQRMLLL